MIAAKRGTARGCTFLLFQQQVWCWELCALCTFSAAFDGVAQPLAPVSLLTLTHSHSLRCQGVQVPERHLGMPVMAGILTHIKATQEPGYLRQPACVPSRRDRAGPVLGSRALQRSL